MCVEKLGVKIFGNGELIKKLFVKVVKFFKFVEVVIIVKGGLIEVI